MWVVLIAGSTGAALSAVRPPNRYVTPACPAVISLRRESGGFLVAFVPDHHGPSHPGELVGERDGSDLGGSPRQQSSEPGSMRCAVDLGIADHGERASREQAAAPPNRGSLKRHPTPWHSRAGGGAVHSIISRLMHCNKHPLIRSPRRQRSTMSV